MKKDLHKLMQKDLINWHFPINKALFYSEIGIKDAKKDYEAVRHRPIKTIGIINRNKLFGKMRKRIWAKHIKTLRKNIT
jgi:hypothetical protein